MHWFWLPVVIATTFGAVLLYMEGIQVLFKNWGKADQPLGKRLALIYLLLVGVFTVAMLLLGFWGSLLPGIGLKALTVDKAVQMIGVIHIIAIPPLLLECRRSSRKKAKRPR